MAALTVAAGKMRLVARVDVARRRGDDPEDEFAAPRRRGDRRADIGGPCHRAALLAGDEHLRAGSAFGVGQVPCSLTMSARRAAPSSDAEHSAEQGEGEDVSREK